MKRNFILFVLCIVLIGCSSNENNVTHFKETDDCIAYIFTDVENNESHLYYNERFYLARFDYDDKKGQVKEYTGPTGKMLYQIELLYGDDYLEKKDTMTINLYERCFEIDGTCYTDETLQESYLDWLDDQKSKNQSDEMDQRIK